MTRKHILCALAGATALAAFATPASAQQVDRIISFGDSYADADGNLFQLGVPKPVPDIYPYGAFSNGQNYVSDLGEYYDATVLNFAIGGAKTDNTNVTGAPFGFVTEYNAFLTNNTFGTVFPNAGGFQKNDLVTISIGGNDARAYSGTLTTPNPLATTAGAVTAGQTAAAQAKVGLDALVAAGAPTISWLSADTANLPEVSAPAGSGIRAIRTSFYNAYDAATRATLAGYAANGTIVHYLDGGALFARVVADPAAYGLTSAGACPATSTAAATACIYDPVVGQSYLFYLDQVHLTAAGNSIIAKYIERQVAAPYTLEGTSTMALDTASEFGRTLSTRMDLGAPRDGDQAEGTHFWITGDSLQHRVHESDTNSPYKASAQGVTVGADMAFGAGTVGAALNYSRPHVNFGNDASETNSTSWQLGGYGSAGIAGGFVQGYLGFGWDKHKVKRQGVIDAMDAHFKGNHATAGAKVGYLMPLGIVRLGPIAALDYASAKVNGYTEDGDAALTLNVDSVKYKSLKGSFGLEARGDSGDDGVFFRPYLALTAEKDFTGDDRAIQFSQTSAPTIVNTWNVDASKKMYARIAGGASAQILDQLNLNVALSTTSGKSNSNETTAHVGLRFGF